MDGMLHIHSKQKTNLDFSKSHVSQPWVQRIERKAYTYWTTAYLQNFIQFRYTRHGVCKHMLQTHFMNTFWFEKYKQFTIQNGWVTPLLGTSLCRPYMLHVRHPSTSTAHQPSHLTLSMSPFPHLTMICNHQTDNSLYVWPDVWSGDLQVTKMYGHPWHWMSLLRQSVIKQPKPIPSSVQLTAVSYYMAASRT